MPQARARSRLCIADVALFYGERSGGIRTYLDAKATFAAQSEAFEHHLVVPGTGERHDGFRHELPSICLVESNGYRVPLGARGVKRTLEAVGPDVVLLHDPFWRPVYVARVARDLGAAVVAVQHGTAHGQAGGIPGPSGLYRSALQARLRRLRNSVDAVMAASGSHPDEARTPTLPLRFGLDPAFRPSPAIRRADHVLFAGRLSREKGIFELLEAAAHAREPWPLEIIGAGPAAAAVRKRVRRLGLGHRASFRPFVSGRAELARAYGEASCVVAPGPHETFGLVALEAAASGGCAVACEAAPSATLAGGLVRTFRPGDVAGLAEAIETAREQTPDLPAAQALASRFTWERAFRAELADLRRLLAP